MLPQTLTSAPARAPWRATRSTARAPPGRGRPADRRAPRRRGSPPVVYWMRSLVPIEKKSAAKSATRSAAAGTSTIMPKAGMRASRPSPRSASTARSMSRRASSISLGTLTIGTMTFSGPAGRGAGERAQLHREHVRARQATGAGRARPGTGWLSPSGVRPGIGLSPPASSVRIVTGRPSAQARSASRLRTAAPRRAAGRPRNRNSVRVRPMPSQCAASTPCSSAGSSTLMWSFMRTPSAVRGRARR